MERSEIGSIKRAPIPQLKTNIADKTSNYQFASPPMGKYDDFNKQSTKS